MAKILPFANVFGLSLFLAGICLPSYIVFLLFAVNLESLAKILNRIVENDTYGLTRLEAMFPHKSRGAFLKTLENCIKKGYLIGYTVNYDVGRIERGRPIVAGDFQSEMADEFEEDRTIFNTCPVCGSKLSEKQGLSCPVCGAILQDYE
jgi:rubrerythrin